MIVALAFAFGLCSFDQASGQVQTKPAPTVKKNSTRKIRVRPSALATKAGTAVNWLADVDAALVRAKETGKPVFWYVPTIPGTFMDRKPVVDRYMMAGYFSWPKIVASLNEDFVAVKASPTPQQQKKYELSRFKFIEPGFLVLDPDGKLKSKVDRLTTQHPLWMLRYLAKFGSTKIAATEKVESLFQDPVAKKMAAAMETFRTGDHAAANSQWTNMAQQHPEHPLGWKAAAEAQGIGPFTR